MRTPLIAAAFALAATAAVAQTPPATPIPATPPAAATPAPANPAPSRPQSAARPQYRQTLEERFAEANTSKDGKLTKDQAERARWTYVARNFDAMDKAHQGYLTVDGIRGYARERRAARQAAQQPAHS